MNPKLAALAGVLCLLFAGSAAPQEAPAPAAAAAGAAEAPPFKPEEIEQIVAPVALYPDSLMLQIMMAATYPLEVVQAHRWLQANKGLTGDALDTALKDEDWDPSVKSICAFPDIVKRMNDNLDWTQDMGDAFLAQEKDVLDAVQRMRAKAKAEGNLESTEQQTVKVEQEVIIIEQPNPEVVYVPTYYPTVVYGSAWYYPWRYPALYVPPPYGYAAFSFAAGVACGAMWSHCDWHGDYHGGHNTKVNIDIDKQNNFNNRTNTADRAQRQRDRQGQSGGKWNHDASHRRGVNYKSPSVSNRYGGGSGQRGPVSRDTARGRERAASGARPSGQPAARPSTGGSRSPSRATNRSSTPARRDTATSGSRNSSFDQASRSRGQASRSRSSGGGRSYSRPSGGGSRSSGMSRGGGSRGGGSRGGGGGRGGGGRR